MTGDSVAVEVTIATVGVKLPACVLADQIVPDKPGVKPSTVSLPAKSSQSVKLIDGLHTFTATCKSSAGTLTSTNIVRAADGKAERCLGFAFTPSTITVSTLAELSAGIVGDWQGCVTTPWMVPYWVDVTFRADGTYSANSPESFDGVDASATYYGTDTDSPKKRYQLNDLQDNMQGIGDIDIVFDVDTVNRDDLRHITLMGRHCCRSSCSTPRCTAR